MKRLPQFLMFAAALSLLALFFMPMWKIQLFAPQYPDGVEMHIWINKIGGNSPGTLQNVNILNHYVGMKEIVPDAIPELQYFPYIIGAMIGLGLIAALIAVAIISAVSALGTSTSDTFSTVANAL